MCHKSREVIRFDEPIGQEAEASVEANRGIDGTNGAVVFSVDVGSSDCGGNHSDSKSLVTDTVSIVGWIVLGLSGKNRSSGS